MAGSSRTTRRVGISRMCVYLLRDVFTGNAVLLAIQAYKDDGDDNCNTPPRESYAECRRGKSVQTCDD